MCTTSSSNNLENDMSFIENDIKFYREITNKNFNPFVDPTFRLMHFPLDDMLDFYLKMILFIKKN